MKSAKEEAIPEIQRLLARIGVAFWEYDSISQTVFGIENHNIMFGVPYSESWDHNAFKAVIFSEDRNQVFKELSEASQSESSWALLTRIVWPDGNLHWIHFKGSALRDERTGKLKLRGLAADLTKLKQVEEELQVSQMAQRAAETANRAKSLFLANISHELRTPMHGILSFAQFGQAESTGSLKEYFDEIYSSADSLMNLLNDILDLSKLESGTVECQFSSQSLKDACQNVISRMKGYAQNSGIQLVLEVDKNSDVEADINSAQIMQVLGNLIGNAIKFSFRNTTIRVKISSAEEHVRVCVSNQGVGIPASEIESIFDKYVQSSKTRTSGTGTGLGLAISHEIIRQHNGKIFVESVENGETHFTFEIPKSRSIVSDSKKSA